MKLRIASKILKRALETGVLPKGDTLARAVAAQRGNNRKLFEMDDKYFVSAFLAAAIRKGVSMNRLDFILAWWRFRSRIEAEEKQAEKTR